MTWGGWGAGCQPVSPCGSGTGTGMGGCAAAGAGHLWLTERCFWLAPTSPPGEPPRPAPGAPSRPGVPQHSCVPQGRGGSQARPRHRHPRARASPLPWQGGQQAAGITAGSAQERGHNLFSQLTSPSWQRGAKVGVSHPCHSAPPPSSPVPLCHGHRHPAHLAGTAGAGLSLGGEGLAVHHLPTLVVAVCGERGSAQCVVGGSPGWGGDRDGVPCSSPPPSFPSSYRYRRGNTRPRDGRDRCRRWHSPRASRPPSPAARDGRDARGPGVRARRGGLGKKRGSPANARELFPAMEEKTGAQPTGQEPKTSRGPRCGAHQADAAETGIQDGGEGLVVVEDPSHVGAACGEKRGTCDPQVARGPPGDLSA